MTNAPKSYVELRAKPVWSFDEFLHLVGLPDSTAEVVLAETPVKFFTMGRRRFILQSDALSWLELMAKRHPYTKRRNSATAPQLTHVS